MPNQNEPSTVTLHDQPEWLRVTLSSICDAVITTNNDGNITFLNPVAEALTGWALEESAGQPLKSVFQIINEQTRESAESPTVRALRDGVIVGLANHTVLISRDGTERPIDDSAAPIRNADGKVAGVVLVFRDVTNRNRQEHLVRDALTYADNIIATVCEPFLVLDEKLRVVSANESFHECFHLAADETHGRFIYDLGHRQWDIPRLRTLLNELLLQNREIHGFEMTREFPTVGRKVLLLNARRIRRLGDHSELILLSFQDITGHQRSNALLSAQKNVLELSASGASMEDVFDLVVRAVRDDFGDECRASLFLNEPAGLHLRFVAGAGLSDACIRAIDQFEIGPQIPSCDTEVFSGQPIIVCDVTRDARWGPYLGLANEFEIGAVWTYLMTMHDGKLLGTLAIYHRTPRTPRPGELDAVQLLSQTVALVIERSRESEQRKAAEDAMRASEIRLQLIMDSMPEKVFTTNPEGMIDYFNRQWTEFTGLSFAQMQDSGWTHLVHPDDLEKKTRLWNHAFTAGEPFQSEHRFRRANGAYRWHFSRALPIRDSSGRITMWVGTNTDIHDIKQIEAAMRVSEIRYRRLFETAKDGILILDFPTGKIVDANPFMSDLLGYSLADFSGKELWEIGLFGDKLANEAAVRDLQEHGYLRYENLPLVSSDGRRVEVEVVANAYREDEQTVIQSNIRDITDRSRLEKLLRGKASELSDLHRRKDEFLAMLSHELRSPLAPIANAVQLLGLQQGNESRIHQQARVIIERQLHQLQHLVDDLLEVSRITTGRVQLRLERTTVSSIVTGAVESVRPLITQRQHDLTVSVPTEPIWLLADAGRLEQVLVNLLSNAAKYTEENGHIWLTVVLEEEGSELRVAYGEKVMSCGYSRSASSPALDAHHSPPTSSFVQIRVRDTGVGIDPSLLPRIFDLFTQAERSLDRSQGGLGIGMALVHRLTELHGGTVEAHSTLGLGSEFIVRLPLEPTDAHESASLASETNSKDTRSLRVLVVDDNVDTVLSFSMLLEAHGHEVRTANDGIAAMKAATEFLPDVALLDIGLPGLNGYEVAKRIRQHPDLKHIELVAVTGYGQDSDRKTSLEAGFNHHLVKPAILDQLLHILATISAKVG